MRNPKAFAVGLIVIILLLTGAVFLTRKILINQVKSQTIAKASPSPQLSSSPSSGGFSKITNTPTQKPTQQNQARVAKQPDTGIDDVKNVGIFLHLPTNIKIYSPVKVSGQANVYEGKIQIMVKDSEGLILGGGYATACMGLEDCPFETFISFNKPTTSTGTIEAWAQDEDQQSIVQTTDITFK